MISLYTRDGFEGVILSCAFFESNGIIKFEQYLKSEKINIEEKKYNRLGLSELLVLLFSLKIINHGIWSKMWNIKDWRDDLAHKPEKIKELITDENKAKKLIFDGIECIKALENWNPK